MLSINTIISFLGASIILCLAPGPDNIFVLTQSAMKGKKAGIIVTLGLCTGLLVHTSAVAYGVAAIFQVSTLAFTSLKIIGGCYLLYLAWQALRAKSSELGEDTEKGKSAVSLYKRGIIMNVTNPKVAIFFMAFLPQFTDPDKPSVTLQMFTLGFLFIISCILVFFSIAFLSGLLRDWLIKSPKSQQIINKIAGLVFVTLAIKLFITKR